jgi:5-methylcytosine-specific restriction enzyme subunit McrC
MGQISAKTSAPKGSDPGGNQQTEYTRAPRGRLLIDPMIKQQTMMRGIAVCELDELTPDILHNRILLSTLLALSGCSELGRELRHELRQTARRFKEVSTVRLTGDLFHRVQLSRNTAQYGLLMRVCEFVFYSLMPDEAGSGARFQSILKDETRMSALFEDFLRNFYRSEFPELTVGSEIMTWQAEGNQANPSLLPIMRTDITIRSKTQTTIIDAKYYAQTLSTGRYGQRIRSAHLYQLATYLTHEERRSGFKPAGMLLYPKTSVALREQYTLLGYPVTIATVDLGEEWSSVGSAIRELLTIGKWVTE